MLGYANERLGLSKPKGYSGVDLSCAPGFCAPDDDHGNPDCLVANLGFYDLCSRNRRDFSAQGWTPDEVELCAGSHPHVPSYYH